MQMAKINLHGLKPGVYIANIKVGGNKQTF